MCFVGGTTKQTWCFFAPPPPPPENQVVVVSVGGLHSWDPLPIERDWESSGIPLDSPTTGLHTTTLPFVEKMWIKGPLGQNGI